MAWHEGLTEKQRKFCEAYSSNGGIALQAAESAGYKVPLVQGTENMQKPSIKKALELLRLNTTNSAIATREQRQSWWTAVMRDNNEEMKSRIKASELLGKSQADFINRTEITGRDGEPLAVVSAEPLTADEWEKKHGTPEE